MNNSTLSLKNVSLSRGAITDLSIEFQPGTHLIVGPNGIGKTSLLNSIAGTLKPISGSILLDDHPIHGGSTSVVLAPGSPPPIPWIRAELLLEFIVSLYPATRKDMAFRQQIVAQLGIDRFLNTAMGALSAGTAKKVLLAAALIAAPPIMLFDEPTNEIDAQSVEVIMRLLAEIAKDKIVLITTHHVSAFAPLAPTVLKIGREMESILADYPRPSGD